jgi:hypothetical protein
VRAAVWPEPIKPARLITRIKAGITNADVALVKHRGADLCFRTRGQETSFFVSG